MKSKWKAALNQIWLAWTPVIALWGGVLGGWQPLPPFSAYIFVPVVLITATAGQLVLYTYEHEMVDWTDVIGTIEQLVIIGAITGAFAVGFYANAILTTKIFYAAILGQALGVTIYRVVSGTLSINTGVDSTV